MAKIGASGPPRPAKAPGGLVTTRQQSLRMRLATAGFADATAAKARLQTLGAHSDALLSLLTRAADPDQALGFLVELAGVVEDREEFLAGVAEDEGAGMRLVLVTGASRALGEHLVRHPDHIRELYDPTLGCTRPAAWAMRSDLVTAVGGDPRSPTPVATAPDAPDRLRVEYRRHLLRTASRDLAHEVAMDDVGAELSDLAGATLEAALAVARQRVGEQASLARLAVVAMGKTGGHELNYVSDVDVIFVARPAEGADEAEALKVATRLASALMSVCGDQTGEGTIWPVDAALRPEGKRGPLVRTLASHVAYYERWAKTWEFQALLKARPIAGDAELGAAYVAAISPMVWMAATRQGFVGDVQTMRQRVVDHIPARELDRELKLGVGGLRDVEFAVQLLQLVHGRTDESLRQPATLSALSALTRGGYVGRHDGAKLTRSYRLLRTIEHRLQLQDLRRTHLLPVAEEDLRSLGRSLGFIKHPQTELETQLTLSRQEVRRLHEKLFYRPLLEAVAKVPTEESTLSPQAARVWLAALGYSDPQAALAHLQALTEGVSRTAAIQRALMPAMLSWFAEAPDPDLGMLGFRKISEALGRSSWYLALLRDEGEVAERLAKLLATSRYATDLLEREPSGVRLLTSQELAPLDRDWLVSEMSATSMRQDSRAESIAQVRAIRRRELLRVSAGWLGGVIADNEVAPALTSITLATLESALDVGIRIVEFETHAPIPTRMAVVAMGRLGGHEIGFGSDADVMFVHDPLPGADPEAASRAAHQVANEMRKLLGDAGSDPALELDADLRPEGRGGALVRTLDSYRAYYSRWSEVWEAQALLRAHAAVGDDELCAAFTALVDPLRYPQGGVSGAELLEIRRIKARVDKERLPRGADPSRHLKLGPGGLTDIEWSVQLLQLRFGHQVPGLQTTSTLRALQAAADAGLVSQADSEELAATWKLLTSTRDAITQVRGKPGDQLPREAHELAAVAYVLGWPLDSSEDFTNAYLRATRRSRAVVERVFWE